MGAEEVNDSCILLLLAYWKEGRCDVKLHHVLSPPRGGRTFCSGLHSLDLPLCVFLFTASLRFIPHLETKTDTTCGADDLS